jgi:hypothetical protein
MHDHPWLQASACCLMHPTCLNVDEESSSTTLRLMMMM